MLLHLLLLSLLSMVKGDIFSDTALPISINKLASRSEININMKSAFFQSINISNIDSIEGAMIIVESDFEPIVKLRFISISNNKSDWLECKSINEPFSLRWFSGRKVKNVPKDVNVVEFEVKTAKNQEINVHKIGLFIQFSEDFDEKKYPKFSKKIKFEIEKPRIITRDEWGARPPQSGYSSMPYFNKMTLHHSAGFSAETLDEGIAQMQAIQTFHQDVRGWSDIGYHFVIDKAGNIYQGRPETVIGAHTGGSNTGNIGACLLGCYHPPASDNYFCYDEMTGPSNESIIKLFAWTSQTYNIPPYLLKGHRDYYDFEYTSCPGNNLWSLLPELRQDVENYKNFGPTPDIFSLYQNYPNPFNNKTEIKFDIASQGNYRVEIFDIIGRKIRILSNRTYNPGEDYSVFWDGKNEEKKIMPSGIYFCSVSSISNSKTIRMVFLK